jgi:serine/threonine-protein kinase
MLGDRYRLTELLGEGGMATIYLGRDLKLDRDVAVKLLRSEYGRDEAFVARFRQEAYSAASLSHPNVVQVYDYGTDEAGPFIVMEYVDGQDLGEILRDRGFVPSAAAARIAMQVADGWPPPTRWASSTATSSHRTSWSASPARSRSRTSASRAPFPRPS